MISVDYIFSKFDNAFQHQSAFHNIPWLVNTFIYEEQGYDLDVYMLPSAFIFSDDELIATIEGERITSKLLTERINNLCFVDFMLSTPDPITEEAFLIIPIVRDITGKEISDAQVEFYVSLEDLVTWYQRSVGNGVEIILDVGVDISVRSINERNVYRTQRNYINKQKTFTVRDGVI